MRWVGLVLLANDLVPTLTFIALYHRYQPGPTGWRSTEFGRQMMALAAVIAGLLLLTLVGIVVPMTGWPRAAMVALAVCGHLSLSAALWWRVRLLVRAQRRPDEAPAPHP